MNLNLTYDAFYLEKKDHLAEEYEDAYSIIDLADDEYRFSIADGATESSFAGIWARLLTEGYSKGSKLDELQTVWKNQIEEMELPWYSQEKAEQGAFAAFLGLTVVSNKNSQVNSFEAISIGDCCLFHIRDNELVLSYPIKSSADFDNSPLLVSSKSSNNETQVEFETMNGKWIEGDKIFLMTDALACWFLSKIEKKDDSLGMIMNLSNQDEFRELVAAQRELTYDSGLPVLKNDDVTLVRINFN